MINGSPSIRFLGLIANYNWKQIAPSASCLRSISLIGTKMATRRSARLSAAIDTTKVAEAAAAPAPAPAPAPSRKRKAVATRESVEDESEAAPSTPQRRRPLKRTIDSVPETPTPAAVNLIAEPASRNATTATPKPKSITRLADPNRTNALLLSPQTSRVVTPTSTSEPPPTPSRPVTTSDSLLSKAEAHLIKVDPRMKPLIQAHHCRIFSPEGLAEKIDPFESLASGIISQQVSGAAAKAIKKRFISLFCPSDEQRQRQQQQQQEEEEEEEENPAKRFPTPLQVSRAEISTLRSAGLSQRKAEYVRGLAEKFVSGDLSAQMLADASYDEVLEKLIQVRGLGRWSVEMFACFGLKRMDVFSLGDLGVQRGMAAFVGRDVAKLKGSKKGKWKYMSEKEMEEISERFRPYRSLFMWYMWRVEETDISTME